MIIYINIIPTGSYSSITTMITQYVLISCQKETFVLGIYETLLHAVQDFWDLLKKCKDYDALVKKYVAKYNRPFDLLFDDDCIDFVGDRYPYSIIEVVMNNPADIIRAFDYSAWSHWDAANLYEAQLQLACNLTTDPTQLQFVSYGLMIDDKELEAFIGASATI